MLEHLVLALSTKVQIQVREHSTKNAQNQKLNKKLQRILKRALNRLGLLQIIEETSHEFGSALNFLPLTEKPDYFVLAESLIDKLANNVHILDHLSQQDQGSALQIKELYFVIEILTSVLLVVNRKIHVEVLDVQNKQENHSRDNHVAQIYQITSKQS